MKGLDVTNRNSHGFTIIELVVTLTLLAMLSTMAVKHFSAKTMEAAITKAHDQTTTISTALKQYRLDRGSWPPNLTALQTTYLDQKDLVPPFGGSFGYSVTNNSNGGFVQLTIPMGTAARAAALAGRLPHGELSGTVAARTRIYRAGMEVSLDGLRQEVYNNFYQVDGMTNIRADVNFRGFSALNLDKVYARAYYDLDDPTTILDPSGTSHINNLYVRGDLHAPEIHSTNIDSRYIWGDTIETDRLHSGSAEFEFLTVLDTATIQNGDIRNIRSTTINNTGDLRTSNAYMDFAKILRLSVGSATPGSSCNAAQGNIAVSGSQVLVCNGSRWSSNRVTFGNNPQGAFAASVYGYVDQKGEREACKLFANGYEIALSWAGGGSENISGGGTVIPVDSSGSVRFTSTGQCLAARGSVYGYFRYE